MLNKVIIMGRLTRTPELRKTVQGTSVVSFTLAVDRDFSAKDGGEKKTDFIDCTAWRQNADFLAKYFSKGSMAVVDGRLQMREWTDNMGNRRVSAEVLAEHIYFGESRRSEVPDVKPMQAEGEYEGLYPLDDDDGVLPF